MSYENDITDVVSQNIQLIYEDYRKNKNDLTIAKLKIIDLEGQLIIASEVAAVVDRNYERSLQDLQHYKIKSIIEKPVCKLNDIDEMDVDIKFVFKNNDELIKRNFELVQKMEETEMRLEELTYKCEDFEIELVDVQNRNDELMQSNKELMSFISVKKDQLLELCALKLKIHELENANKPDNSDQSFLVNINKMKELELRCFNLQRSNEKLTENHANLMLLGEENATLSNQNERLKEKVQQYEELHVNATNDRVESNMDHSIERRMRHVERENEILRCQQSQVGKQNAELKSKIGLLDGELKSLRQGNNTYQILLLEKEKRVLIQEKEIRCLNKDCQSFKQILGSFTEQCALDADTSDIVSRLCDVFDSITEHKRELEEQTMVVDQLVQLMSSSLENLGAKNITDETSADSADDSDKRMIAELRGEVERLNEDLQARTERCQQLEDNCRDLTKESCDGYRMETESFNASDMGFCDTGVHRDAVERNTNVFRRLSRSVLEAVKTLMGYSLELGPNGHVTLHSCLSDDSTEVLEFRLLAGEEPFLIDNLYTKTIRDSIDFKGHWPSFLSLITLHLQELHDNSMS